MFNVTLTFDSYEEALRVKQSAIDILNEYMFGEDPCEHFNHGTPENALEILVDALHNQIPVKGTMKEVVKLRDDCTGTEAGIWIDDEEYCIHYFENHEPIAVTMTDLNAYVEQEDKELAEKVMGSRDDAEDKDAWDDFKSALEGGGDD